MRGGKRPGAGRKPKQVTDQQHANHLALLASFAPEDIGNIAAMAKTQPEVLKAILPWLLGPKELVLSGNPDAPIKTIVEVVRVGGSSKADTSPPT